MKMPTSHFLAVCYADIFDYPLKEDELEKWQISKNVILGSDNDSRIDSGQVFRPRAQDRGARMTKKGDFFCLKGREKIIKLRQQREKFSQEKLVIAQQVVKFLQKIPFIKLIAVTGALAMKNSPKDDDIDLLIITEKNRLWLTRLLATIILELLRKRRHPQDKKFRNKVCLNMFLDEEHLLISQQEQNPYTAHEVCQIKPIYDKAQTYKKFLIVNDWVKKYLPRVFLQVLKPSTSVIARSEATKQSSPSFFDFLEPLAFKLQYFYMKKRITRETVEKGRILFHPRDTSNLVLKEFENRVKKYF